MSGLKAESEKKLCKALSFEDLRYMAYLAADVSNGKSSVELYRDEEQKMAIKYGFKVK